MPIDPDSLEALQAMTLGLAFAGLLASAFEMATERRASFALLHASRSVALLSVPMLVFSAPFIILRNTVRGRRFERRPIRFVFLATVVACFWSLLSGRVVLDVARLAVGA